MVAPLVGAWIEIKPLIYKALRAIVAPLVGAWIEIVVHNISYIYTSVSLLSWERGLKFIIIKSIMRFYPSLLSWERGLKYKIRLNKIINRFRRSSRGSVD